MVAAWFCVVLGMVLGTLTLTTSTADAQNPVGIATEDYVITDAAVTTQEVVITLSPNGNNVAAVTVTIDFDPLIIAPQINPANDQPLCTPQNGFTGSCGPVDPTDAPAIVTETPKWYPTHSKMQCHVVYFLGTAPYSVDI